MTCCNDTGMGQVGVAQGQVFKEPVAVPQGYPYPRPDTSFLMVDGEVFLFDNCQWQGLEHMPHVVGRCG